MTKLSARDFVIRVSISFVIRASSLVISVAPLRIRGSGFLHKPPHEGSSPKLLPFLTLLVLFLLLSILSPYFLTADNLSTVARQTAVINIIAIGMTLVIIAGGVDRPSARCSPCAESAEPCSWRRMGVLPSTVLGIVTGAGWGLLTGLTITTLRVQAFIATLGGLGMARGLTC
jgi:ribose transport system permease protein